MSTSDEICLILKCSSEMYSIFLLSHSFLLRLMLADFWRTKVLGILPSNRSVSEYLNKLILSPNARAKK